MADLKVRFNKDETITVRVGRYVEIIDAAYKTKEQLFDSVKYVAMSKGAILSDIKITEIIAQGKR
jgi:hypothetical protein